MMMWDVGATLRSGDLNAGPLENPFPHDGSLGNSSVSNGVTTDYFSLDIFNSRQYRQYGLSVYTSLGWESLHPFGGQKDDGLSGFLSLTRVLNKFYFFLL